MRRRARDLLDRARNYCSRQKRIDCFPIPTFAALVRNRQVNLVNPELGRQTPRGSQLRASRVGRLMGKCFHLCAAPLVCFQLCRLTTTVDVVCRREAAPCCTRVAGQLWPTPSSGSPDCCFGRIFNYFPPIEAGKLGNLRQPSSGHLKLKREMKRERPHCCTSARLLASSLHNTIGEKPPPSHLYSVPMSRKPRLHVGRSARRPVQRAHARLAPLGKRCLALLERHNQLMSEAQEDGERKIKIN